MLDLRSLLELVGFDPAEVIVVRHAPAEKSLKRVLPWLVQERPELFKAYQQIQWGNLGSAMKRARYFAAFIAQDNGRAVFAGIYKVGAAQPLDFEAYCSFPGNRELEQLGMAPREPEARDCFAFELQRLDTCADWIGRLVIEWPKPYRNWWRWAATGSFAVAAIEAESQFTRSMPHWQDLVLNWPELSALPGSWKEALKHWRGIYLIWDTERRAGYVGSASGETNILGRWLE